jgi:chromosome segregation ATPase
MADTNYPSASTPQSQPPRERGSKNLIIGILVAGLLGTWGYLLWDKNKTGEKLEITQTQSDSYMTQRDSLKAMYDIAEIRLDSITGANNNLQGKMTDQQKDIEAKRAEIRRILNDKNATTAQLNKARGLIAELNDKINTLEADVTRLQVKTRN